MIMRIIHLAGENASLAHKVNPPLLRFKPNPHHAPRNSLPIIKLSHIPNPHDSPASSPKSFFQTATTPTRLNWLFESHFGDPDATERYSAERVICDKAFPIATRDSSIRSILNLVNCNCIAVESYHFPRARGFHGLKNRRRFSITMSYNGQRGPAVNMSEFIGNLNVVAPAQDTTDFDSFLNQNDDFSSFTQTNFFDFDQGQMANLSGPNMDFSAPGTTDAKAFDFGGMLHIISLYVT